MEGVLVTILSVGMVVKSAHHHGTAGGATGSGGKGVLKNRTIFREGINSRRLSNAVAVATEGRRFIVCDKKMIFFSAPKQLKEISEKRIIIFENDVYIEVRIEE